MSIRMFRVMSLALCVSVAMPLTGCSMFSKMLAKKKRRSSSAKKKEDAKNALAAFRDNTDCEKSDALYKASSRVSRSMRSERELIYVEQLAKCGKWAFFFQRKAHYGRGSGVKFLRHLEKKGYNVEKAFFKWLGNGRVWGPSTVSSRGMQRMYNMWNMHASTNVATWLLGKSNPKKYCRTMYQKHRRFAPWVMRGYTRFVAKAECPNRVKVLRSQLLSRDILVRQQSCRLLGEHGTRSDINRLYTLARTDSSWYRFGRRRYWTSTVCRSAAGRLKLRLN